MRDAATIAVSLMLACSSNQWSMNAAVSLSEGLRWLVRHRASHRRWAASDRLVAAVAVAVERDERVGETVGCFHRDVVPYAVDDDGPHVGCDLSERGRRELTREAADREDGNAELFRRQLADLVALAQQRAVQA